VISPKTEKLLIFAPYNQLLYLNMYLEKKDLTSIEKIWEHTSISYL